MMMLKVSQIFGFYSDDSFSLPLLGLASDCTPRPAAAPPNPALVTASRSERRVLINHGLFEKVVSPFIGPQMNEFLMIILVLSTRGEMKDILTTFTFPE